MDVNNSGFVHKTKRGFVNVDEGGKESSRPVDTNLEAETFDSRIISLIMIL